jgi:hypothetical protein
MDIERSLHLGTDADNIAIARICSFIINMSSIFLAKIDENSYCSSLLRQFSPLLPPSGFNSPTACSPSEYPQYTPAGFADHVSAQSSFSKPLSLNASQVDFL